MPDSVPVHLRPPTAAEPQTSGPPPTGTAPSQQQQPMQTGGQRISPMKSRFCTALNGARLDAPLGMQSYTIDDLALSASSSSNEQVGPQLAR